MNKTKEKLDEPLLSPQRKRSVDVEPVASLSSPPPSLDDAQFRKYGSWDGVFVRVVCSVFGVLMFLRMAWVLGQAGLFLSILIIFLSIFVTITTTISMTALATNGQMSGGGPYYLVSRSAGAELGATFGMILPFAQTVAVALNCIGFAETVKFLYQDYGYMTPNGDWDTVIIALLADLGCFLCCIPGLDWLNKTNAILLGTIMAGFFSFAIGSMMNKGDNPPQGFTGWDWETFKDNLGPKFVGGYDFWGVLGVYFPSVTGIMTGVSLSGELKNPARNIPEGTLWGIGFTTVVYILICVFNASIGRREDLTDTNNYYFMANVALVPELIHAGVFAASLSTAISLLSAAPRIFAAVIRDGYADQMKVFAQVNHRGDPIYGYILCWVLSSFVCFMGRSDGGLNLISKYVSSFYMVCYSLVNFSCYYASASKTPGWRPMFRYYNKWHSLSGAIICIGYMFLMDWISGVIILFLTVCVYFWIESRAIKLDLGAAGESFAYWRALTMLRKLQKYAFQHVKNFRPQILILRAFAESSSLADISVYFYKSRGIVIVGDIEVGDIKSAVKAAGERPGPVVLSEAGEKAQPVWGDRLVMFRKVITMPSVRLGVVSHLQTAGLGRMIPNTVFLDYMEDWKSRENQATEYLNVLRDIASAQFSVALFRNSQRVMQAEKKGNVDVYWLRDDGGMQLLLPSILLRHPQWENCCLRVFVPKSGELDQKEQLTEVQKLLTLIRIKGEAYIISSESGQTLLSEEATTTDDKPLFKALDEMARAQTSTYFQRDAPVTAPVAPQDDSVLEMPPTSYREKKLEADVPPHYFSEYVGAIRRNSADSVLTFISLPIPSHDCSSQEYLSALDNLTASLPAAVLTRGNGQNVVTALL